MTLGEKVLQIQSSALAIPRLGVRAYDWWNKAQHGVVEGRATVLPPGHRPRGDVGRRPDEGRRGGDLGVAAVAQPYHPAATHCVLQTPAPRCAVLDTRRLGCNPRATQKLQAWIRQRRIFA